MSNIKHAGEHEPNAFGGRNLQRIPTPMSDSKHSATAELRTKLLYAEDAAAKGEAARAKAAEMQDDIDELRAQLDKETGKLVSLLDVCREEGWNGVENSKFADTFLRVLISELRANLKLLEVDPVTCDHQFLLRLKRVKQRPAYWMEIAELAESDCSELRAQVETLTKERDETHKKTDALFLSMSNQIDSISAERDAALAEIARLTREVTTLRDTQ